MLVLFLLMPRGLSTEYPKKLCVLGGKLIPAIHIIGASSFSYFGIGIAIENVDVMCP